MPQEKQFCKTLPVTGGRQQADKSVRIRLPVSVCMYVCALV